MTRQAKPVREYADYPISREIVDVLKDQIVHDLQDNPELLHDLREVYRFNDNHPRPRVERPKKLKLLENYDENEANALFHIIANKKRDVKMIRDALTKEGAQNYINKRRLQEHLYVDDRDIDGDSIPDIVVRQRNTNLPVIVKGYHTVKSDYPLRHSYYRDVPREDRKEVSIGDYLNHRLNVRYDTPLHRVLNRDGVEVLKSWNASGYKKMTPKEKISVPLAFKLHFMKPLMRSLKQVLKANNIELKLKPQVARDLEAAIRNQLITIPAMKATYGEEVMNVIEKDWKRLMTRKEYKVNSEHILRNLMSLENHHDVYFTVLTLIVNRLAELEAIQPIPEQVAPQIVDLAIRNVPKKYVNENLTQEELDAMRSERQAQED
jgi:hypothetical protein